MNAHKVVIVGSNGQLGSDLLDVFAAGDVLALTHRDLEITDADAVGTLVRDARPAAVINAAAFHDTSECETSPAKAFEVNSVGALNLARACASSGSLLVHVSTDYVFDGLKGAPYVETDRVAPLNAYGLSKAAGELAVLNYCEAHYVVRTSGLYGLVPCRGKGDNFVTKIRRAALERGEVTVVDDEIVTPTWTATLARQIKLLCDERPVAFGLVHASDEGECSWYEFTEEIFRLTSTTATLTRASVAEYPSTIRRPRYSVLGNRVLESGSVNVMTEWKESLARYLALGGNAR